MKLRTLSVHPLDAGTVLVPLTHGFFALIDAIDAGAVGLFNWHYLKSPRETSGYARCSSGPHESLHRVVAKRMGLALSDGVEVDHENMNGLDCRRSNLRVATKQQNGANKAIPAHNTSGLKGVTFHAAAGKWQGQIRAGGRYRYLGLFESKEAAGEAVAAARAQLHGPFARSN